MTTQIDPEYLTTREAADIRRKSPEHLRYERMHGEGPPYIRDGGRVLYPRAELYAWLEARRVDPSATAAAG